MTISSNELSAMKRMAAAGIAVTESEDRDASTRASRKAASIARSSAWPNTLEGLRRRKDEERLARAAAAEAAAAELDREAADARLAERLSVLQTANAYFEGQSDKVKALRNFRQRVADRESNTAAMDLRARRKEALAGVDRDFFEFEKGEREAGDARDAEKKANARARAAEIAAGLTAQVKGCIQRRADDNAAEDVRAAQVKADANAMAADERAALARKAAAAAAGKLKFAADNAAERAGRAARADDGAALTLVVAAQVAEQDAKKAIVAGVLARIKAEGEAKADIITGLVRGGRRGFRRGKGEREREQPAPQITFVLFFFTNPSSPSPTHFHNPPISDGKGLLVA